MCSEPGEWSKWVVRENKWCSKPHYFPCGALWPFHRELVVCKPRTHRWFLFHKVQGWDSQAACWVGTSGRASQMWWCGLLWSWAPECVPGALHWSHGRGAEFAQQGWGWIWSLIWGRQGTDRFLGMFKCLHCLWESCLESFNPVLSCQQSLQQPSRGGLWQAAAVCGVELWNWTTPGAQSSISWSEGFNTVITT